MKIEYPGVGRPALGSGKNQEQKDSLHKSDEMPLKLEFAIFAKKWSNISSRKKSKFLTNQPALHSQGEKSVFIKASDTNDHLDIDFNKKFFG